MAMFCTLYKGDLFILSAIDSQSTQPREVLISEVARLRLGESTLITLLWIMVASGIRLRTGTTSSFVVSILETN